MKLGSKGIRPPAHRGVAYAPAGIGNAECGRGAHGAECIGQRDLRGEVGMRKTEKNTRIGSWEVVRWGGWDAGKL
jgi:hypothetical protein